MAGKKENSFENDTQLSNDESRLRAEKEARVIVKKNDSQRARAEETKASLKGEEEQAKLTVGKAEFELARFPAEAKVDLDRLQSESRVELDRLQAEAELRIREEILKVDEDELNVDEVFLRFKEFQLEVEEARLRIENIKLRVELANLTVKAAKLRVEAAKLRVEAANLRDEKERLRDEEDRLRDEEDRLREEEGRLTEEEDRLRFEEDRLRAEEDRLRIGEKVRVQLSRLGFQESFKADDAKQILGPTALARLRAEKEATLVTEADEKLRMQREVARRKTEKKFEKLRFRAGQWKAQEVIRGELESKTSKEGDEEKTEDQAGLIMPAEGLITPSGFSSIPVSMETPEIIKLRKRKIKAETKGGESPPILRKKGTERAATMVSTHIYDMAAEILGSKLRASSSASIPLEGPKVALDTSELDTDTAVVPVRNMSWIPDLDTDTGACYEQTKKEQQSQQEKEDLSEMVAEHDIHQTK